jgi:DNA-directed RNA polymerase specialized sigma24 family protein
VQEFLTENRALVLKHARAHAKASGEKVPAEDIARELELVLLQLHKTKGLQAKDIPSPDGYLRSIVLHAAHRAKRRRTLIEQISAGDDLQAIGEDLTALDADLPDLPKPITSEAAQAHETLEKLKAKLSARDALICALLLEDGLSQQDVARTVSVPISDLVAARERILRAAGELGIEPAPQPLPASATPQTMPESERRGGAT